MPTNPVENDAVTYIAVGDIHGRLDLLKRLHEKLVTYCTKNPATYELVYLGDYIDRGPHSKQVVDFLLEEPELHQLMHKVVYLRGNHEQALLISLQENGVEFLSGQWLRWGGGACLASYGVAPADTPELFQENFLEKLPTSHLHFYEKSALMYDTDKYLFVHAGVRPGVPLSEQRGRDLMFIRSPFIPYEGKTDLPIHDVVGDKTVVFGHTIMHNGVYDDDQRLGIDTGAYMSGKLTAAVLKNDGEKSFIQT